MGLIPFKEMTSLDLCNSAVTDAGLKELANLQRLTKLILNSTKMIDGRVAELKKPLPKC